MIKHKILSLTLVPALVLALYWGMLTAAFAADEDTAGPMTRADLMVLLHTAQGSPVVNYAMNFSDVAQDAAYAEAIRWAVSEGLAEGYGDSLFGPEDPVTREQLLVVLWRQAHSPMLMDYPGLTQYEDAGDISLFARQAMLWAHQKGLLDQESRRVEPQAAVTQDELGAMLAMLAKLEILNASV